VGGVQRLPLNPCVILDAIPDEEHCNEVVSEVGIFELSLEFRQESWPIIIEVVTESLLDGERPQTGSSGHVSHSNVGLGTSAA
jgi:hypothetical protein